MYFAAVQRVFGPDCHGVYLQGANGSQQQNIEYCTKDKDFEQWGKVQAQGKRTDLQIIKDKIDGGARPQEIADEHFAKWVQYRRSFQRYRELQVTAEYRPDVEVYLLVGNAGTGKSRFVYEYTRGEVWINSDPTLRWFDGYTQQETVLLDDFRGDAEFALLLRLLDIYPIDVQVKGGFVPWNPMKIFVTSNVNPESWYVGQDTSPLRRRFKRIVKFEGTFSEDTWQATFAQLKIKLGLD